MKQSNDFAYDMIDLDVFKNRVLFIAMREVEVIEVATGIEISITLQGMRHEGTFHPIPHTEIPHKKVIFHLASYGDEILRFSGSFSDEQIEWSSVMLSPDSAVESQPLHLDLSEEGIYRVYDDHKKTRAILSLREPQIQYWSNLQRPSDPMIQMVFYPDGNYERSMMLMSYDHFFPGKLESVPLGCVADDGIITGVIFSFHAKVDEHFYGTGERFNRIDLAGSTVTLENTDALGTASRKAYKNVPFVLSSKGYGWFIHSSSHMRLSFADISNRAMQALIDDTRIDLFLIGGGQPERVLCNYRRLTGFSPPLPLWSYGMWMSRMSYYSAAEVEGIANRLRSDNYPCDVIHLDSGYFTKDWVCDWAFSEERFPHPKEFIKRLREKHFYVSVWQTPNIGKTNRLYEEAKENGYLPDLIENDKMNTMSDFSGQDFGGQIDMTYPAAVAWYKDLLRGLFDVGVSCIKADFGEKILMHAAFKNMPAAKLHNLYALLYHKAVFEVTAEYTEKPFIWARSTWAGGQRFPLHWGGDTSATWDGLAATLRGGLQLGLSGYTFWSHDIPGFHGLPEFMNSRPTENLYLRWTQFGVFTSHMRYHGASAREPWEYPNVARLVRSWLYFRYALIPYILQEADYCITTGRPILAALLIDYPDDPGIWHIDDEYLFGRDFLVAPIMNDEGIRSIYLPHGKWVELYSGKVLDGGQWLNKVSYPLAAIPVFVRLDANIPYYPERVLATDEMNLAKVKYLSFHQYDGLVASPLGQICGFTVEDFSSGVLARMYEDKKGR